MSLVELALLIWIGKYLGVITTVALVLLTAIVGASMAKFEGMRVWTKLLDQLRRGELPGDTIVEGVLIFGGGVTFLTPGFMTDFLGLLCLFPLTRKLFREWVKAWFKKKIRTADTGWFQFWTGTSGPEVDDDKDPFESDFPPT